MKPGIVLFEEFIKHYEPSMIAIGKPFCHSQPCKRCMFNALHDNSTITCNDYDLLSLEEVSLIKGKYPEYFL